MSMDVVMSDTIRQCIHVISTAPVLNARVVLVGPAATVVEPEVHRSVARAKLKGPTFVGV